MLGLATRLLGGMVTPLIDQITSSSARLLRKLALFVVAALSLVVVLIALTIAFDLWVASMAGAIVGALAVAGVYLAIAILAVWLALRPVKAQPVTQAAGARKRGDAATEAKASAASDGLNAQVDGFVAPLLEMLRNLGLRREQMAVLAGVSIAKQIGPVPLVGLAILSGFLIGRMWGGWRAILSSDLVATLLSSTDLMARMFAAGKDAPAEPPGDAAPPREEA